MCPKCSHFPSCNTNFIPCFKWQTSHTYLRFLGTCLFWFTSLRAACFFFSSSINRIILLSATSKALCPCKEERQRFFIKMFDALCPFHKLGVLTKILPIMTFIIQQQAKHSLLTTKFLVSMLAMFSQSISTASRCPQCAAACRGVHPSLSLALMSTPASNNRLKGQVV